MMELVHIIDHLSKKPLCSVPINHATMYTLSDVQAANCVDCLRGLRANSGAGDLP